MDANFFPISENIKSTLKSNASSYQSEFENFIQSQISKLIVQERERSANQMDKERELIIAIEFCKQFLLDAQKQNENNISDKNSFDDVAVTEEKQCQSDVLVKLVELKLELEEYKDSLEQHRHIDPIEKVEKVKGHEFTVQSSSGKNAYCEACLSTIWRLVQRWRRCKVCGFRVHEKCLGTVKRLCAGLKVIRPDFLLQFQLCPEQSLRDQNYKCAECSAPISYDDSLKVPRLCDYTGYLYCRRCHWNDEMIIPARLVRNWDMEKRPVCRATKQLLNIISRRPLINLSNENPLLFKFVHTLNKMQKLRSNIMFMKCYFVSCKIARRLRILQHLNRFQHFVETDTLYSMEDLVQLASGRLLPEIESIVHIFRRHITQECEICRGNAFYCELCLDQECIFPFSDNVAICKTCIAVYHCRCFDRVSKRCPRCARRNTRRKMILQEEQLNEEKIDEPRDIITDYTV